MALLRDALVVLLLLPCLAGSGLAEEHRHDRHHRMEAGPGWHGDIGRFHERDIDLWRGGHWHHGRHEGRHGWWWIVGGAWYFYPARIAPYPDPYRPPVMVVAPSPTIRTQRFWYYCAEPVGYYPYVARCAFNWQRVAATVPAVAPPPY